MNCKICRSLMKLIESDSRQEWYTETYSCKECGKNFLRRVTFKVQSELVDEDILEEIK